ncbi:MAG: MFS transporter [Campylobacteraceae bacterium]|nr:MFS transporter [Campylobacteraceae bacterium]
MKQYLNLLKSNKTVRTLSTIQLLSYFGAWFSHVGVFTLLIELNAPVWMISLTVAMAFIPNVILAPISGIIIDRFKAYPLFLLFLTIQATTVLLLLLVRDLSWFWFLQVLVFIRMGTSGIYFQTEMSLLPKILNENDLKLANEIHSIIWAVSYTLGMASAGIFINFFGVYASFKFDFIIFLIGIFLLLKLNLKEKQEKIKKGALIMMIEGFIYLKKNPLLINLILIHGFVAVTSYDTLINILAKYSYKGVLSTALVIGFINAFRAFGLVVGPMIFSKRTNKKTLFYLFILQGIGLFSWAVLQHNLYLSFIGLFITGLSTSTLWSYTYTLVQVYCDKRFYGRVIAYLDMVYLGLATITSLFTGFLYEKGLSPFMITMLIGVHFILAGLFYKRVYDKSLAS